jgi:uridine kinase
LRSDDQRTDGVLGRYDVDKIQSLLMELTRRSEFVELELPVYDKTTHQQISGAEIIPLYKNDIVIVEGTFALALLDSIPGNISHSWYVEINEDVRQQRVLSEYRLHGSQVHQEKSIYQVRQDDETRFIVNTAKYATQQFIINLADSFCKDHQHPN